MSEPLTVREAPANYVLNSLRIRPGYKQTEVGLIPDDWEYLPIADSIDLLTGFPFPSSGYANSGVRLLRGSNVKRGVTDWSEEGTEYWSSVTADIRKYILKSEDIVIAMDGSLVGRSFAMLSDEDVPSLLLQRVARIRSNSISQKYLKAWICSLRFTEHCDAVKTVSAIPHISPGDIRSFKVVLPPTKAEQEAIAEALSDADALIDALEQLITKKRHLKQGAMQELLTGKRRLPGFGGEWKVKRLGDLAEMGSGGTPLSSVAAYYDGDIPWVSISDMTNGGKIIESTERNLTAFGFASSAVKMFPVGTVLYAMYASLGECSIAGKPLCTSQAILGIRAKDNLNAEFLYYYLSSLKLTVRSLGQQGTQSNLNKGMVQEFRLSLPPVAEQTAIATILSDMDTELAALEQQLAKACGIKQGMMQELLTGNIRLI